MAALVPAKENPEMARLVPTLEGSKVPTAVPPRVTEIPGTTHTKAEAVVTRVAMGEAFLKANFGNWWSTERSAFVSIPQWSDCLWNRSFR